jgi:hypothetical protein
MEPKLSAEDAVKEQLRRDHVGVAEVDAENNSVSPDVAE